MPTSGVIILGGGSHATVVAALLRARDENLIGYTDVGGESGAPIAGAPYLGEDAVVESYDPGQVKLAMGIGGTTVAMNRRKILEDWTRRGYSFLTALHPASFVDETAVLGDGVLVMAGAVVQPGCRIDDGALINTSSSVDHDCRIGAHASIAPGSTLCGGVTVGADAFVGAGATILQGVTIGDRTMVAAGAVVVSDVRAERRVRGLPAEEY